MYIVKLKIRYVFIGLVFVSIIALLVSCLSIGNHTETVFKYDKYLDNPPDIRVLLQKDVEEVEMEIEFPYNISDLDSNKILASGNSLPGSVIYRESGEFRTRPITSNSIQVTPATFVKAGGKVSVIADNGFIRLNKLKHRGKLILVPGDKERFSVLEEIDVEGFLPGVIEGEMPTKWQDDAIQAQVIAARTYAIYQRKIKSNALYHIDKLDLAYKGSYMNKQKAKEIVDKSRGTVMLYNWELFPGYFHSTCGGHTEDINLVFKQKSIPPLSGVYCGFCNKSKYYNWKENIRKSEIEKRLGTARFNVRNIYKIYTEGIGPGGHCSTINIQHSGGTEKFNANEFRLIVGPNHLYSTAFKVKDNGSSLTFEGHGWGHGVGLCQYGTQDMAKSGFKWFDILRHYYPEIDLVKIY